MLAFNCPHCNGLFQVDFSSAGQRVACPHCHRDVTVPAEKAADAVPAPSEGSGSVNRSSPLEEKTHTEDFVARQPFAFPAPPTFPRKPPPTEEMPRDIAGGPNAIPGEIEAVDPPHEVSPSQASTKDDFLQFECPKCSKAFRVAKAMVGSEVVCPFCEQRAQIPADAEMDSGDRSQAEPSDEEAAEDKKPDPSLPEKSTVAVESAVGGPDTPIIRDEGVKRIVRGQKVVEIRRLSPEEKARRRFRKNLIMVLLGGGVLAAALIYFAKHGL